MSAQVVFVHGMFMTPSCWDGWVERWAQRGFQCTAPAWPMRQRSVAELRAAHPDPALGALTLDRIVESYEAAIQALPTPPVIIGHSMGGLITQILLGRGLGVAGVAIDSAPPKGVFTASWSFLKSNWPMVSPFAKKDVPHLLSFEQFHYAFAHVLPEAEVRAVYDAHVVPESRNVPASSLGQIGTVDFEKPRAPLLLVAGELDHIIPAKLNRKNQAAYRPSAGVTDFREFPGRTHYILAQQGWEEVSDFVQEWVGEKLA